jgi:hypothetical protein
VVRTEDDGWAHWCGGVHQLGVAGWAAQGPWWAPACVGASSCFGLRVIIFEDLMCKHVVLINIHVRSFMYEGIILSY